MNIVVSKMNSVQSLLKVNFSTLSLEDKCKVKKLGRPLPELKIEQKASAHGKEFHRYFNKSTYSRNNWICGCETTNRLFCFPCILFSKGEDPTWIKFGVNDLGHLSQKIKRHSSSDSHVTAVLDLSILGKINIREMLSDAYRRKIDRENDQIRKNRYILSKIVDCIKFCGEFELALRGHDETEDSRNPGIFRGLVNFTAALDKIFYDHISSATVFKGISKDIQNDLLECMLQVCQDKIREEISRTEFLSVISDETTDVSAQFQQVVVFRYVLGTGKPIERFWSFFNPETHDAVGLSAVIKESLVDAIGPDDKKKLISQSYDGANVMSGRHAGVQALIRQEYPYAYFVHCYAHQLNLIMVQAVSHNREARIFFANISEISTFFTHSSQRISTLDEIVKKRLPSGSATRWNFNSRAIMTIYENKDNLIECFEKIETTSEQTLTVNQAQGIRLKMQQVDFNFWLEVFYKIMPHVDILYNQLQARNLTPDSAERAVDAFQSEIRNIIEEIDEICIERTENERRKRHHSEQQKYLSKSFAAKEVCDVISSEISERFNFTGHLMAAKLFDFERFETYANKFPSDTLNSVVQSYPFLEQKKLKTELNIIYRRQDFRSVSKTTDLLGFFKENNLEDCFCEASKLLLIIITMPMTSSEAERNFSCLKRIKIFLRNSMGEDRLSALAMLSINREIVQNMVDFNEKVIDLFAAKKERRLEFNYRHAAGDREE